MTIGKVIRLADALKPNAVDTELKYQFISEVEGLVQTEVMMLSSEDIVTYEPERDSEDTELLVKPPHDKLYIAYLAAMLDYSNGEYNKYANTIEQFNAYYREYHRWYFSRFHPADGQAINEGYYLSAYAIAVRHGFEGTEAEWIASLNGQTPELRYSGNVLEWKYTTESDSEWRELIDVSDIYDAKNAAAASAAEAKASAAEASGYVDSAKNYAESAQGYAETSFAFAQNAADAADRSSASAGAAESSAVSAAGSASAALETKNQVDQALSSVEQSKSDAAASAREASDSADAAAKSAIEAAAAAGGGVSSFNGRNGAVVPKAGDYTADMVGAVASFNGRKGAVEPKAGDYTADMVGADPSGTASTKVSEHNSAGDPHPGKFAAASHKHDPSDINTNANNRFVTDSEKAIWSGKQDKHSKVSITLAAASWSSNAQTVTVSGVTADNTVMISPAPASQEAYTKAGVYCSAQAANSLTFTCKTAPTAALTVNIVILGG